MYGELSDVCHPDTYGVLVSFGHLVACAGRLRAPQLDADAEADVAKFKAIVVEKADKGQTVSLTEFDEADLMDGDVTVRIGWSTINYKDGLAITGKAPVVRRFPMIPGIDFAGEVEASSHPDWKPGDKVILNGWGTGETHLGAYAEKARVKGQWLVRLPAELERRARRWRSAPPATPRCWR